MSIVSPVAWPTTSLSDIVGAARRHVQSSHSYSSPGEDAGYRRCLRRVGYGPCGQPVERFLLRPLTPVPVAVPIPCDLPADPVVHAHARRIVQLILEVLDGRRPAAQLSRVVDSVPLRYLHLVGEQLRIGRDRRGSRLLSMRVCQPHSAAAEIAAVCCVAGRIRAAAARIERSADTGAWHCQILQFG